MLHNVGTTQFRKGMFEGIPWVANDAVPECKPKVCPIGTICPYVAKISELLSVTKKDGVQEKGVLCRNRLKHLKYWHLYYQKVTTGYPDDKIRHHVGTVLIPLRLTAIDLEIEGQAIKAGKGANTDQKVVSREARATQGAIMKSEKELTSLMNAYRVSRPKSSSGINPNKSSS